MAKLKMHSTCYFSSQVISVYVEGSIGSAGETLPGMPPRFWSLEVEKR